MIRLFSHFVNTGTILLICSLSYAQNNSDIVIDGNSNTAEMSQTTIDSLNRIKLNLKGKDNKFKLEQAQKESSKSPVNTKKETFIDKIKESDHILSPLGNLAAILTPIVAIIAFLIKFVKNRKNNSL